MQCISRFVLLSSVAAPVAGLGVVTVRLGSPLTSLRRGAGARHQATPDEDDEWASVDWANTAAGSGGTSDGSALEALLAENAVETVFLNDSEQAPEAAAARSEQRLPGEEEALLRALQAAVSVDSVSARDAQLGWVDSHALVEVDAKGEPFHERFVYVDEHTCIGCTMCATTARSTFFMEDTWGRARVYQQQGDADEIIAEAIDTCPVNCIHYVPWAELKALERGRRKQVINNAARLVNQQDFGGISGGGGIGALRATGPQDISGNRGVRCSNCPGNGCRNCPMYGVGENPLFLERERKKKEMRRKREIGSGGGDGEGGRRVDL